jgi:hypothetical protein
MNDVNKTNSLAVDLMRARGEKEIVAVLKKHGYYEEAKCDKCVHLLEARNAVIY